MRKCADYVFTKQLKYADDKKIPYVLLVGEDEIETGILKLKNMLEGTQESIVLEQLIEKFKYKQSHFFI